MIVYPNNWRELGKAVTLNDIDNAIRQVISEIDCCNLSYSGGVDSSLLLYYLLEIKGIAKCFTMTNDKDHPDIYHAQLGISYYEQRYRVSIPHSVSIKPNLQSDDLVKCFYSNLPLDCKSIITGDCIDELAGGYYGHQEKPYEETYQEYLRKVQNEQLIPLDKNSGKVKVHLPYCDDRFVNLLYRVPLYEKVDFYNRKIIIYQLAEGKVPDEIIQRRKYGFGTIAIGQGVTV